MEVLVDELLEHTFAADDDSGDIAVILTDISEAPLPLAEWKLPDTSGQDSSGQRLDCLTVCPVGGREWHLSFFSTPGFMQKQDTWQAWYVMASALLFTALLNVLILLITGRTEQIRQVVDERTAELVAATKSLEQEIGVRKKVEEALREKTGELERSNRDLEQFAYATSHDLQEPLRTITSFLQLFVKRYGNDVDEKAHEFIDFVVDGADRMKSMINALLTYSRVGTRGDQFEPADLEQALIEVKKGLSLAIEESGAQISHDPLPTVTGDAHQLSLLLQNLIGNAIKFRGDAPPEIHVGATTTDDTWEISVQDNGIGIDREYSERVFQVFQRLHSREEYPGTGVGLAVCRRIVERHGGHIWVESEPGQGTTFRFTLPRQA
jgi:light-regulated signal transduction histidine kinase (bacteriophytochrome)